MHTDSSSCEDEDRERLFSAVLASIRLNRLPEYGLAVRKTAALPKEDSTSVGIGSPLFGSYHVLFPVEFEDGVRWLLKVPANGTANNFDESAKRSLTSEALTMRLLKRETTIPVPEIFAFDATLDNELKCPFILMEFIAGIPLYDCWFGKSSSKKTVQTRRERALEDIAAAMVQLDKFSFDQGGSIIFDDQGHPSFIGPTRYADNVAMLERLDTDDPNQTALYIELGPQPDARSYYTCLLDRRPEPPDSLWKGSTTLLRLFTDWIPEPELSEGREAFVLNHPDFDIQNVIVSENGQVRGLIDWDGVHASPRSLGNERYPGWLTRDWDPAMYGWKPGMDDGIEPAGCWEDSPETLHRLRAVYAGFMESLVAKGRGGEVPKLQLSLTRNSLFTENLCIAASNPPCTFEILKKLFYKIAEIVGEGLCACKSYNSTKTNKVEAGQDGSDDENMLNRGSGSGNLKGTERDYCEPGDFCLFEVAYALAEGDLDERRMKLLREGFGVLLSGNVIY